MKKWPDTLTLICIILVLTALLTWIVPAGSFDYQEKDGTTVAVSESYHALPREGQGITKIFMAPFLGFKEAAGIIAFVLMVGGVFQILNKTEAVDRLIGSLVRWQQKKPKLDVLFVPIFMTLFSLCGAIFGMSEEVIPFVILFMPLALAMGYDKIVGVAIPFVGAGAGFAGAFLNPFTIGIAQGIAELPPSSGLGYRLIVWFIVTTVAIVYVMRYARKIRVPPKENKVEVNPKGLNARHVGVLLSFVLCLVMLILGVLKWGWYIKEMCGLFLGYGVLAGFIAKLKPSELSDEFVKGASALLGTALIIAFARGILVIAQDGHIIDTFLQVTSQGVAQLHPVISSQVMFILQSTINFFIPSGSGQAALTMPIMAPLGEIVGVSRQTVVLAYQLGDGFGNLIIPTSAVTMGVLAVADLPYEKWFKWILPLEIAFFAIGLILLIPPYFMAWQ